MSPHVLTTDYKKAELEVVIWLAESDGREQRKMHTKTACGEAAL